VLTKRELSNTAKLSVFKSIFVPILTYGHESCVMTERINSGASTKVGTFGKSPRCDKVAYQLDCAGQETSLASPYLNLSYFGIKCPALKKNLQHCCDFSEPPSDSVPEVLCPPRYALGVTLRYKVRSCEIRSALNDEPLLLTERKQLR